MNQIATTNKPDVRSILACESSDGEWIPPKVIEDWHRSQARAILADYETRGVMAPAEGKAIAQWLMDLGTLCAANMTVDDARLRVAAYESMLIGEFEAGCFTKGSLKRIAPKFTWFPAYAEVFAALKAEKNRLWKERERLKRLANPPKTEPERAPPTPEQQAKVATALAEIGIKVNG
jgi:hypothetical protein